MMPSRTELTLRQPAGDRRMRLSGLVAAVALELVAGGIAFLTDAPLVALVLCMIGLIGLGVAGNALRKP